MTRWSETWTCDSRRRLNTLATVKVDLPQEETLQTQKSAKMHELKSAGAEELYNRRPTPPRPHFEETYVSEFASECAQTSVKSIISTTRFLAQANDRSPVIDDDHRADKLMRADCAPRDLKNAMDCSAHNHD
jgi:hypothetical protein